jgi:GTP-binding protein Era
MNFVYSALETADVLCLLIDAAEKYGHGDEFVIETLRKVTTPLFLLINKVDIVRKDTILPIIDKYKDLLPFKEIIPISALKGINLDILEKRIYDFLPDAEKLYEDGTITDQTLRFQLAEIIREKLLKRVKEELPFVTAVLVDTMEERKDAEAGEKEDKRKVTYIRASIFVEKDTQRGIIIGRNGRVIKEIGIESRREIEKILDSIVYLDLKVKVRERWRDSAAVLDLIEGQR